LKRTIEFFFLLYPKVGIPMGCCTLL